MFITIVLFVFVGNYGIGRVRDLQSQISQAKSDKIALTEKLNILQTVSATVADSSLAAASALPGKNSVLVMRAQLKSLAGHDSVVLSNLKSDLGSSDISGLSKVGLTFNVAGSRTAIIVFLKDIENTAPVSLVDKITFSENAGGSLATVSVKSFWAAFPKILPSLTEPITDLTADEKSTLEKISALSQPPSFGTSVSTEASGSAGRSNPFLP